MKRLSTLWFVLAILFIGCQTETQQENLDTTIQNATNVIYNTSETVRNNGNYLDFAFYDEFEIIKRFKHHQSFGKTVTSDFSNLNPISPKELADEFTSISEEAEEFPHGFTAGGHPVGCAIALKAIDVIMNEGLLENVKNVSPYFHERLQEFNQYEHIGETRGIGLMAALEMVKNKDTKEPFEGHLNMGDKIANMSIDNGLICRPLGPAIVLCPQFIITKKQIDEMFDSLHSTLKQAFN